jgi:hypothetical protein
MAHQRRQFKNEYVREGAVSENAYDFFSLHVARTHVSYLPQRRSGRARFFLPQEAIRWSPERRAVCRQGMPS